MRMERFRLTLRARLAYTYAGLLTLAGALMMLVVYLVVGFLPTYTFAVPSVRTTGPPAVGEVDPGIASTALTPGYVVSSRDDVLRLILVIACILLVLLAVGGGWVGWVVSGRMLRPLQEVNAAAHRAARGHLDHRISLRGPRDEISDLADTFDEMLEGLERSFATYRRFAANASHELRTPLATTRAMLDVALAGAEDAERPLLQRLRETNERSIQTVESLLDLSEVEAARPVQQPVELEQIVSFVLADVAQEADEACIRIDYRLSAATVNADPTLLRQLVLNLIQNAIRHNSEGGWIVVTTSLERRGCPVLQVKNSGAHVPESAIDSLTSPFFRLQGRSTASTSKGRGLGLSIIEAIADRHDAHLGLEPGREGGLVATVTFPSGENRQSERSRGAPALTPSELELPRARDGASRAPSRR